MRNIAGVDRAVGVHVGAKVCAIKCLTEARFGLGPVGLEQLGFDRLQDGAERGPAERVEAELAVADPVQAFGDDQAPLAPAALLVVLCAVRIRNVLLPGFHRKFGGRSPAATDAFSTSTMSISPPRCAASGSALI